MAVRVDVDICTGRSAYIGACLIGALSINDDDKSIYDEGTYINCGSCVNVCPASAISQ